jgi:hypothetical protein
MSKKTMLLTIVVSSVAMFALPSMASAAEIHFEGATGTTFVAHGGPNVPYAANEPAITCETGQASGEFTSETTGVVQGYVSGCHFTLFGITAKCHTTGSPLDNTITSSGTFHLITTTDGAAMLGTLTTTTVICAGVSNIEVGGSLITTITKPACGGSSKEATGVSSTTNGVQTHKTYTGKNYFPTARTLPNGAAIETGLDAEATITFSKQLKLVCT